MGTSFRARKMKVLVALACLVLCVSAIPQTRNELTCNICMDIMTDLDNFITSETTEQQIVDQIKEICKALGQIIDGLRRRVTFWSAASSRASSTLSYTTTWTRPKSALSCSAPARKTIPPPQDIQINKHIFFIVYLLFELQIVLMG